MTPWPIKLAAVAFVVTAVAWMAAPTIATSIGLLIMWAIIFWLYVSWERTHERGK